MRASSTLSRLRRRLGPRPAAPTTDWGDQGTAYGLELSLVTAEDDNRCGEAAAAAPPGPARTAAAGTATAAGTAATATAAHGPAPRGWLARWRGRRPAVG